MRLKLPLALLAVLAWSCAKCTTRPLIKAFFTLLLLVIAGRSWAQETLPPLPVDAHTGLITYTGVVPTPGVTQANLLTRAKVWANHVSVPTKPPLIVNEMGTDVLVVAFSQQLPADELLSTTRLYTLAQISLREGRYQYRFEEFTFETSVPSLILAERLLLGDNSAANKSTKKILAHARTQFEQAVVQAAATLRESLLTPIVPPLANGTDW